ncbi:MAG TPA: membrane dipeptidase [Bryobacteraceae bacterium]|nr:membrane dipeptidase [Bryobacteraceae bacterium]
MKITALVLLAASCACGQTPTFDFEDSGLPGWTQSGNALTGQPLCKRPADVEMSSTDFAGVGLGGDYWKDLQYPLGQHGNCIVTSLLKTASAEPWSLTSPEFLLPSAATYLSFLIGGSNNPDHQRLELQVRHGSAWDTAYTATGPGGERLQQQIVSIAQGDLGQPARIRIYDDHSKGHLNVDYIRFTSERPPDLPDGPVWGYADYHTHPMTYLAFGSNDKRRIIFGKPGGNFDDYHDTNLITKDIPHCTGSHGGGYLAQAFINTAQLFSDSIGSVIKAFLVSHKHNGGPQFNNFPSHLMGAHQQMHITMIRRNYEGGLRLMVALVTDNWGAGFLTGVADHGVVPLVKEQDEVALQMKGLRDLVALNSSWMEIARNSADARRIILQNKLAIVPGVELDQLGSYDPDPDKEVEFLWNLGVRAITPIHAVDNKIGSPAILNAPYNWLNDFIGNGANQVRPNHLAPARFFQIEKDDCAANHEPEGECVLFKLSPFPQLRLVIARPIFTLFRRAPGFVVETEDALNTGMLGQKNSKGLAPAGPAYIRALMRRGMIIDTAHMSDKSVNDTYQVLAERSGYPAVISHAHFRKEGLYKDPENEFPDYLASEYDISDSNLRRVRSAGGVVGVFLHQARINPESIDVHISHITDDCGNSSKGFAFAYHYGQEQVPGGMGLATDMTFIPVVSPRFGDHACEGYKSFQHGQREYAKAEHRSRYQPHAQKDPILYEGIAPPMKTNQKEPLKPYIAGSHTFDFNIDGLAHFGLVPDMLQDLRNVEMPKRDLQALFGSAEAYLQMWERVERAK